MSTPEEKHLFRVSLETALTLLGFVILFTALSAWVYLFTKPTIEASTKEERLVFFNQVLPRELYNNDPITDTITLPPEPALGQRFPTQVYRARMNGKPAGLIIEAIAPDGYSGDIKMLIGLDARGNLLSVRVTEHKETPGLGDYIDPKKDRNKTRPWITQFENLPALSDVQWHVKKDGGVFDAVAGATVTPRAVVKAVHKAVAFAQTNLTMLFAPAANSENGARH
ncbi:MAG: electron transport complex subunit RsxG [Fluviibacter sp.]|jgi:electron transport complex protein RnfG